LLVITLGNVFLLCICNTLTVSFLIQPF
jgi:hypothetical protein